MTMQRKITGNKISYKPMIEAELSIHERDRAYRRQERVERAKRIAENQLRAASVRIVKRRPKDAHWYCLRVETGREFAVEKLLQDANVEVCSPREKWVKVRRGEKIEGEIPFFPSYLLVHCVPSADAFAGLKRQKYVIDIVGGENGYHVIQDEDVEVFKALTQSTEAPRIATDKTMTDGDRAAIILGPFVGFECVVLAVKWSRQARARVLINVGGRQFEIDSMPLAFLKKL
ncbi:transcription termination/antitermination NusG family protein [Rhizobium sp. BK602]|uniref:transcription termination/antitermination protein NusG n=1 Tax=Rhizobium sp. BK602 TaxID=2586986 RepID=UPI001613A173|nr:transcription termination/antitermination NusG family protein [Rhizobium sp. BK602]MBB3608657.1 transcriptional antiterminator NusG [Rhizobium sp. BK602]